MNLNENNDGLNWLLAIFAILFILYFRTNCMTDRIMGLCSDMCQSYGKKAVRIDDENSFTPKCVCGDMTFDKKEIKKP